MEFTASETTTYRGAGLSHKDNGGTLAGIDFAILLTPVGWAEIRENGGWKTDTQYAPGTVFRVAVSGGQIQYSKNGAIFYTSAALPVYPLLADATLWSLNATITNAVIANGTGITGPAPPIISNVSAAVTASGATISWTTNVDADSQVEYGTTTAYGASTRLDSTLVNSHSQTLSSLNPSTTYHYHVISRDADGNAAVSGDFTFMTASPTGSQNIVWMALINVSATGNSLRKTAGCDGCDDAGAVSTQSISSGDGYVEFTASETTTYRSVGLSNGNTDTSLGDIDFAILLTPSGYAEVRENGAWKRDTPYAPGSVFRVAVIGGQIQYSKDGVVFYSSTVRPTYPLLVDTTLFSLNATITNAILSGSR
jgi:hypothetical protein